MQVGVDIGGTFTDLIISTDGKIVVHKLFSTPDNPSRAMLDGLNHLSPRGLNAYQRISHGSTVATNAILERKGGPTALLTTEGFRDILLIGRQNRPELYALQPCLLPPLIPRRLSWGIPERLDFMGDVLQPLDMEALDRILDQLEQEEIQSTAVSFLYSHVNNVHEQAVKERILERGIMAEWQIVLSSEILPEFREYERASTTVLEAYVRPVINDYLEGLEAGLPSSCALRVMTSDGGVMSARRARDQAVHTALSGPAAGVIGGAHIARLAGFDQIITLDMGGTSTDVSLCPGQPVHRTESEIDGLPLRTRTLDIETIGAGGGSIARLDGGGALRVGPESAGAEPGPIVYGKGGTQLTVTDANMLLGRMDPDHFLDGSLKLELPPARKRIQTLAEQMGVPPREAALGIIQVANTSIDRALRRVSVARGYNPGDFTLVAFGGAGPLHACPVAEGLDISRVLIPRYPGVMCAFGLLMADVILEQSRSVLGPIREDTYPFLRGIIQKMEEKARLNLERELIPGDQIVHHAQVQARYQGQSYELTIPLVPDLDRIFHAEHHKTYGHNMPDRPVEMVTLRLQSVGRASSPPYPADPVQKNDGSSAVIGSREGIESGSRKGLFTLYEREKIIPGAEFRGPALVFQMDSTVYIPSGWISTVDSYHNLILERK